MPCPPSLPRLVRAVAVCATLAVTAPCAKAQYTWNLAGGGDWLIEANVSRP